MKTIELFKKVKHLGLETEFDNHAILINDKEGRIICSVNRSQRFQLDMDWYSTKLISDVIKEELLRIVCQYASTSLNERANDYNDKLFLRITRYRFGKFF